MNKKFEVGNLVVPQWTNKKHWALGIIIRFVKCDNHQYAVVRWWNNLETTKMGRPIPSNQTVPLWAIRRIK